VRMNANKSSFDVCVSMPVYEIFIDNISHIIHLMHTKQIKLANKSSHRYKGELNGSMSIIIAGIQIENHESLSNCSDQACMPRTAHPKTMHTHNRCAQMRALTFRNLFSLVNHGQVSDSLLPQVARVNVEFTAVRLRLQPLRHELILRRPPQSGKIIYAIRHRANHASVLYDTKLITLLLIPNK